MNIEYASASVVVLGAFRPDSFQPKALAVAKVISPKDATLAQILMLMPGQAIQFGLPWSTILVDSSRFQVTTTEAPYIRISDFVVTALHDLDTKFSVTAVGINYEAHFDAGSFQKRDAIGARLAPPRAWGEWGKSITESMERDPATNLHGGAMNITMRLPFATAEVAGWRDVSVGPSSKVDPPSGIVMRSNHHLILKSAFAEQGDALNNPSKEDTEGVLLKALADGFDDSIKEAESIFCEVVEL